MSMIVDPPGKVTPRKKVVTLHFLLEETIMEKLERNQIKTLSVTIVIRKDIRKLIVGPKEVEKRDKALG